MGKSHCLFVGKWSRKAGNREREMQMHFSFWLCIFLDWISFVGIIKVRFSPGSLDKACKCSNHSWFLHFDRRWEQRIQMICLIVLLLFAVQKVPWYWHPGSFSALGNCSQGGTGPSDVSSACSIFSAMSWSVSFVRNATTLTVNKSRLRMDQFQVSEYSYASGKPRWPPHRICETAVSSLPLAQLIIHFYLAISLIIHSYLAIPILYLCPILRILPNHFSKGFLTAFPDFKQNVAAPSFSFS